MPSTRAFAALILAVVLAGCLGGGGVTYEMSQQEKQLKNATLTSLRSVDSYRLGGSVDVSGPEESARLELLGVVDRAEKRARISVTVSGAASGEATTYIVNDTAYVKSNGFWRERDVSDRSLWDRNAQLQKQREVFEDAKLEIVGNDTVAGERVTVVRMHVPKNKLDELARLARQGESSEFNIKDVTYTSYIDVETKNLRKMRVEMTMKRDGKRYDATLVMRFSDFGENVTIEVPDEAKEGIGPTT